MKAIKSILVVLCMMFMSTNLYAETSEITKAFANGNIAALDSYLNNNVDIIILNSTNSGCDKSKAKSLIGDFFRKNRPTNYSLTNKTEKGKSALILGNLYTSNGEFVLFLITQKEGNKDVVCQVKITQK